MNQCSSCYQLKVCTFRCTLDHTLSRCTSFRTLRREVESARRAAHEANERTAVHQRREEEARLRIVSLEKDLARSEEEGRKTTEAALADARQSAAALEQARKAAAETEKGLQVQLQASSTEASVAKAAAAALEQRVASLEAALQQSSSVTVTMTSKIAQTMADATAQVCGTWGVGKQGVGGQAEVWEVELCMHCTGVFAA